MLKYIAINALTAIATWGQQPAFEVASIRSAAQITPDMIAEKSQRKLAIRPPMLHGTHGQFPGAWRGMPSSTCCPEESIAAFPG